MKKKLKLHYLYIVFAVVAIFLFESIALASAEKYVTYLRLSDFSGPIAGIDIPNDLGHRLYFEYLNDNGGVDGVKIKYIGVDVRYNVARAVSAYNRYRREKNLFVVGFAGTGIGKAVGRIALKDKVIGVYAGDGEIQAKQTPYTVTAIDAYQDQFGGGIDWILEDWKKKGHTTFPVIGYIGWDNSFGKEPLKGGIEYCKKKGVKLLKPEFFPTGALDHSVYLNRLVSDGANYIIIAAVDPTPTNIIVEAYRMGLTKKVLFLSPFNWSHIETVGMKLHTKELEGTVAGTCFLKGEDLYKHELAKIWTKYSGKPLNEMAGGFFFGMSSAMSFAEALKISLKEVGYEKLSGEVMYKNFQKLGEPKYKYHRKGIAPPCTYSPTQRLGGMEMKFYQVKKGKLTAITGWRILPNIVGMYKYN